MSALGIPSVQHLVSAKEWQLRQDLAFREDEKPRLVADMGEVNFFLLTCGTTIADTFLSMYVFESACQTQIAAHSGGSELSEVPQILQGIARAMKVQTGGLGGQFDWSALLRKLDRISPDNRH